MSFMDPDTAFPLQRAINAVESKRNCSIGEVGNRMWDYSDFIGLISFLSSTFFEVRGRGVRVPWIPPSPHTFTFE